MKRVSLVGVMSLLGFALLPAAGALASPAGPAAPAGATTVTYHGTAGQATRVGQPITGLTHLAAIKSHLPKKTTAKGRVIPFRSPNGADPAAASGKLRAAKAGTSQGVAAPYSLGKTGAAVWHRFNGVSDLSSATVNGGVGNGEVTPPDQGLCTGYLNGVHGPVIIEPVNISVRFTDSHGSLLLPEAPLSALFRDQYAFSDPRCLYDPATKAFYFTVISFPPGGPNGSLTNTVVDVAVLTANEQLATYQFDTSLGGNCLGDQPKTGFSNSELIVSTDEYCGTNTSNYEGAIVLAINKHQLAAEAPAVSEEQFGPVSLAGIPGLGLDPAINSGRTGYLVNSFPFDAAGNNNPVGHNLGLWRLDGNTLTGKVISSEPYAFPVPAASTGDGSTTAGITSEAYLNPDDSRTSAPVNVTWGPHHDAQLWTAVDAAVALKGDPVGRDGAAWFKIDTGRQRVASQGYVGVKGAYLLYPALQAPARGPAAMVFTVTSSSINPSSAFTTLGSQKVQVVGAGSGPHLSFADVPFGPRWGDYSFTGPDPSGKGIWMATEYIPPAASQDPYDNWGTSVFEVSR
jgi:hypothetical protein